MLDTLAPVSLSTLFLLQLKYARWSVSSDGWSVAIAVVLLRRIATWKTVFLNILCYLLHAFRIGTLCSHVQDTVTHGLNQFLTDAVELLVF